MFHQIGDVGHKAAGHAPGGRVQVARVTIKLATVEIHQAEQLATRIPSHSSPTGVSSSLCE